MPWLSESRDRLSRFRGGEQRILAEVYAHYAPGLARKLARGVVIEDRGTRIVYCGSRSPFELDDLVQETFMRAFTAAARESYDGLRPFETWLVAIARNGIIDLLRKGAGKAFLFETLDAGANEVADRSRGASPDTAVLDREVDDALREFERGLSLEEQVLMDLRLEKRMPRRAVEESTGWSAMQVRVRERNLFAKLVEHLSALGIAGGQR